MPGQSPKKSHDQTIASMNLSLHAKNPFNNSSLSGDIDDFFLNTIGMSDHTQQNLFHQTVASMNV